MNRYRIPLWKEDRLLLIILVWTSLLSSWLWWVPIRCMIEGEPFQWANEFGAGQLRGAGMGGHFLVLFLLSAFFISIIYMGWRGAQSPFKPLLLLWTSANLLTTMIIVLDDPSQYRFRGDTMGIDINMAWFMPALKGGLVVLVCYWIARDTLGPRTRTVPQWTSLNTKFLLPILVLLPIQAALLRYGIMHNVTDKIGWVLVYVSWILLILALLPWTNGKKSVEVKTIAAENATANA